MDFFDRKYQIALKLYEKMLSGGRVDPTNLEELQKAWENATDISLEILHSQYIDYADPEYDPSYEEVRKSSENMVSEALGEQSKASETGMKN